MELLPELSKLSHAEKDQLIVLLFRELQELRASFAKQSERIKELEAKLSKDSHNSNKPPSSDGLKKPNPISQRTKSNRKPGGQAGHAGNTLGQVINPDFIEERKIDCCEHCDGPLEGVDAVDHEKRQEFEIPVAKVQVTEYRGEIKICPRCGGLNKAKFPEEITQPVQYGKRVKAEAAYFGQGHFLPYERLQEIFRDIHALPLSEGTLYNTYSACHEKLATYEEKIKEQIKASKLANFDESGIRVEKKLHWLHVAATEKLTHYEIHAKRGKEAMDIIGILPKFKGRAIHDHWAPYFHYACDHGLCNAHHIRELTYHHEHYGQIWCKTMKEYLLTLKEMIDKSKAAGDKKLTPKKLRYFEKKYKQILRNGLKEIPELRQDKTKKRGRKKQHPTMNLWDRLFKDRKETLAFMYDFRAPFTNNQGERDIRMTKLKQKISGSFRSLRGAKMFCRTRGYISTVRKHGINVMDALTRVFETLPVIPWLEVKEANNSS